VHQNATCIKSKKVSKYKNCIHLGKKTECKKFLLLKKRFALSFYGFSVHVSLCFVLVVFPESKYRLCECSDVCNNENKQQMSAFIFRFCPSAPVGGLCVTSHTSPYPSRPWRRRHTQFIHALISLKQSFDSQLNSTCPLLGKTADTFSRKSTAQLL